MVFFELDRVIKRFLRISLCNLAPLISTHMHRGEGLKGIVFFLIIQNHFRSAHFQRFCTKSADTLETFLMLR
jgi:hypothetical protein